jgi:hypothetical protein
LPEEFMIASCSSVNALCDSISTLLSMIIFSEVHEVRDILTCFSYHNRLCVIVVLLCSLCLLCVPCGAKLLNEQEPGTTEYTGKTQGTQRIQNYLNACTGTASISANAIFSPAIAQMKE